MGDYPVALAKIALKSVLETRCREKVKPGWNQSQQGYAVCDMSSRYNQPHEMEMTNHDLHNHVLASKAKRCTPRPPPILHIGPKLYISTAIFAGKF